MAPQPTSDSFVVIESPEESPLCTLLHFALMLSSLRKIYPRVHYTFPAFASFCRGEEVLGSALKDMALEIDTMLQELKKQPLEHLVRIRSDREAPKLDVYQWAHFRGRTFDREHTENVPCADYQSFLSEMNLDTDAQTMLDVYGPLLGKVVNIAHAAYKGHGILKQKLEKRHKPPSLPAFTVQNPQQIARKNKNEN
jgi:hypothetical protein